MVADHERAAVGHAAPCRAPRSGSRPSSPAGGTAAPWRRTPGRAARAALAHAVPPADRLAGEQRARQANGCQSCGVLAEPVDDDGEHERVGDHADVAAGDRDVLGRPGRRRRRRRSRATARCRRSSTRPPSAAPAPARAARRRSSRARSERPCLRRDRSNIAVARVRSPSARHGEPRQTTWRTWSGCSWASQRASRPPKLQPTTLTGCVVAAERPRRAAAGGPSTMVSVRPRLRPGPSRGRGSRWREVAAQPAGEPVVGVEAGEHEHRPVLAARRHGAGRAGSSSREAPYSPTTRGRQKGGQQAAGARGAAHPRGPVGVIAEVVHVGSNEVERV